jgi:hypothetical protein
MTNVKEIALQLSAQAKADAAAIEDVLIKAVADINAILAKYKDVPTDVSLPALSPARNALATISMNFPAQGTAPPFPPLPPA